MLPRVGSCRTKRQSVGDHEELSYFDMKLSYLIDPSGASEMPWQQRVDGYIAGQSSTKTVDKSDAIVNTIRVQKFC